MKQVEIPGIRNGYIVDGSVWRGAQPESWAWTLLASAGCKSVIDLNTPSDELVAQGNLVHNAGIPLFVGYHWNGILPPSLAQIREAIFTLDAFEKPCYVHCEHGSDRTGALCACWRIHNDHWTAEQAMEEALLGLGAGGMHEGWMELAVLRYAHHEV